MKNDDSEIVISFPTQSVDGMIWSLIGDCLPVRWPPTCEVRHHFWHMGDSPSIQVSTPNWMRQLCEPDGRWLNRMYRSTWNVAYIKLWTNCFMYYNRYVRNVNLCGRCKYAYVDYAWAKSGDLSWNQSITVRLYFRDQLFYTNEIGNEVINNCLHRQQP